MLQCVRKVRRTENHVDDTVLTSATDNNNNNNILFYSANIQFNKNLFSAL